MKPFALPMIPRDPEEAHRAATPLELLFDLASVIAIAAAAAGLHHAIADGHPWSGVFSFVMTFFAIWWAWMNFTWFASAYDNQDTVFRVLSMVFIGGAVTMAAGVESVFKSKDLTLIVIGYVIMRAPLILLWLRAAYHDPDRRRTALIYAVGIALVQLYWLSQLALPDFSLTVLSLFFVVGVILELLAPAIAERYAETPWHRHHMMERYGLLTIIVLGEVLLATYLALQGAYGADFDAKLVNLAVASLAMMAAMWWLYFTDDDHLKGDRFSDAITWGYGHFLVFAGAAAVGAGFAVMVDFVTDHADISARTAALSIAIPMVIYAFGLWFVRDRKAVEGVAHVVFIAYTAAILASAWFGLGVWPIVIATMALVFVRNSHVYAKVRV